MTPGPADVLGTVVEVTEVVAVVVAGAVVVAAGRAVVDGVVGGTVTSTVVVTTVVRGALVVEAGSAPGIVDTVITVIVSASHVSRCCSKER